MPYCTDHSAIRVASGKPQCNVNSCGYPLVELMSKQYLSKFPKAWSEEKLLSSLNSSCKAKQEAY